MPKKSAFEMLKGVKDTNGGKQQVTFLTYLGLIRLLQNSRKIKSLELYNVLDIKVNNCAFLNIELDTIRLIMKAFKNEIMITQYKFLNYRVDLYFPDYKIIIECDENQHKKIINKKNDKIREDEIIEHTNQNCIFIRYSPFDKNFCIFDVINKIYSQIITYKERNKI